MLENYFLKPSTVDRIRSSWLGQDIERYVAWMHRQGYSARSICRRVPLLCAFAAFARERKAADARAARAEVNGFVASRLARRQREGRGPQWSNQFARSLRAAVHQMLQLATEGRVTTQRPTKPFPWQTEAPGFLAHLVEERGARPATVDHYAHGLGRLAAYFARVDARLADASPALLASFAIDIASGLSAASLRNVCGSVRVFLRYCHREGLVREDLSAAVELPQSYRLASLPRSVGWDVVERMLALVDRRSALGRRDYAILLLLITYGLRAGEVARLTLDDIDWKRDRRHIRERKAGNATTYPLAGPVAQALIDYIRCGRPAGDDRQVFLRARAPRAPLGPTGVSERAKTYLLQAGAQVERPGAHTLRHTCVQRLVDSGLPFKTVADFVGHRASDSTATYARIDLESLREVAQGHAEEL